MNEELLLKLLEYIDARIDERTYASGDGIIESLRTMNVKEELMEIAFNSLPG